MSPAGGVRGASPVGASGRWGIDDVFSNRVFAPIVATGGTIVDVTIDGTLYRTHLFTSVGASTFSVQDNGALKNELEYLVVGGGGSGGTGRIHPDGDRRAGGGGGAGGFVEGQISASKGDWSVSVGSGGILQNLGRSAGYRGNSSYILKPNESLATFPLLSSQIFAYGGGAGGGGGDSGSNFVDGPFEIEPNVFVGGGSGGGAGSGRERAGSSPVPNQGEKGGSATANRTNGAAGGGGANQAGPNTSTTANNVGTKGGDGRISSITGTNVFYSGGGGGGGISIRGNGGLGGGGAGGQGTQSGFNGFANTGGGGGGESGGHGTRDVFGRVSGAGGSGIVIIRYPLEPLV